MLKMKITAQNTENEKEGTDGQTVKKIKTDWNCGFSKLANLTVSQSSFSNSSIIHKETTKENHI